MRTTTFVIALIAAGITASAADATAGKAVYDKACKSCHGATGTANPAIAKSMKVEMRDLSSKEVQGLSDDQIRKDVTEGHGKMKPVKSVSGPAVDNVIAYVRSLAK